MSDFDKEAEREKLREKFARDDEKRANTQRMSELLLKGATMTNTHCDRCGDPLFRYNGQTFCPSCQAEGTGPQGDHQDTTAEPQSQSPPATAAEAESTPDSEEPGRTHPQTEQRQAGRSPPASSLGEREQKTAAGAAVDTVTGSTGDLTAARASLRRTVTRFAQQAERTDDPRRARELLGAAREAAATLAELD